MQKPFPSLAKKQYQAAAAMLALAVFLLLRVFRLGSCDYWYDEFCTLLSAIIRLPESEPPLYYSLMHYWIKGFGTSEAAVRLFSVIFSFSSVILVYFLGKELFGKKAGALSAVIMGLSPFQLWYAQEARHYSFILFLSLASSFVLLKGLRSGRPAWWLAFVCISTAGLYTHHFYPVLLAAQLCVIFLEKSPRRSSRVFLLAVILALLFIPHAKQYLEAFFLRKSGFWINTPDLESVRFTLENLFLGYHGSGPLYAGSLMLCLALFAVSLRLLHDTQERKSYLFCLILFFLPLAGTYLFSRYVFSIYLDRTFIVLSPFYYLILAGAAAKLGKKASFVVVTVLIAMLAASDYRFYKGKMVDDLKHHNGLYVKKPLKPVARFLAATIDSKNDTVVYTNYSIIAVWAYWKPHLEHGFFVFAPQVRDENIKKPFRQEDGQIPCQRLAGLVSKRLWLIASDWGRTGKLDVNSSQVKEWLDKNFQPTSARNIDGTWVFGYVPKSLKR